jgi:DNA ligase-1
MLLEFKEFYDKITAEAGRNYKISVLEEYCKSQDILYLLDFIYNPYITTGISDKKLQKTIDNPSSFDLLNIETVKNILEYLKTHNTGRDIDILQVRSSIAEILLEKKPDNAMNLLYLFNDIVCKDVQLGIDAKTINKVIPGLIPEFNVQLSNKYFDKPEVVEGKEFVLTTKIDGSRIIAMKDNGKVSFWTRQGQKYEGLVDLEKELLECSDDNFVFDGEIVAIDTDLENTYKNTMKLSRTKDLEKHGLKMLVFDYMDIANFKAQKCPVMYSTRRAQLSAIFDLNSFKYFELLPMLYKGTDTSKIIEILNEQTAKGEEGIMINIYAAPYEFKRTNNLLKVKKFQDTELKVIGFEEGTNKLVGTLGAFICEYKDNTVKVGSGLSDDDRAYFWNNKDKILNKYITVKYFETSRDSKTGLESLRFPIYMRVREDI